MKKLIAFILFLPIFYMAQNHRFTYEYKFVKDTLNKAEVSSEIMNLDVLPKFSKFYSYTVFKNDSLAKADYDRQTALTGGFEEKSDYNKGVVRYQIVKTKPDNDVYFFSRIGEMKLKVPEKRKISWNVHTAKKKIENYLCQKATTEFGGRKWTAWFTSDIPIQDGPYKFSGLPGLIVEMYDATDSHHFKLIGNRKLENRQAENLKPEAVYIFDFGSNKEVDLASYKKLFTESRNDPNKSIRLAISDLAAIEIDGKMMDTAEYLRNREAQMKEKIKHDNNNIELDLLK